MLKSLVIAGLIAVACSLAYSASALAEPVFESTKEAYPVTIKASGSGNQVFTFSKTSTVSCETNSVKGKLTAISSKLTMAPTYGSCTAAIGSEKLQAKVTTGTCEYELDNIEETAGGNKEHFSGNITILPKGCHITLSTSICVFEISSQGPQGKLILNDLGSGETIELETVLGLNGMTYIGKGKNCSIEKEKGENGEYKGIIKTKSATATQGGIKFRAQTWIFSANFAGEAITEHIFVFTGMTEKTVVKCPASAAKFEGSLWWANDKITVVPSYGNCKEEGNAANAPVTIRKCEYQFEVEINTGVGTYLGKMAIIPETEVCEIEIKPRTNCKIIIKGQKPTPNVVEYTNNAGTSPKQVEAMIKLEELSYKTAEGNCMGLPNNTYTNGKYEGKLKLKELLIS